ncbi:MAG: hypothetical protein QOF51_109 [Chloroflexota bacterium]|nr:hypothetical protein [Chloroflexota bacterium]
MRRNDSPNGAPHEETIPEQLKILLPGDVLEVWDEGSLIVKTVFTCHETIDGHTYEWHWMFLDDGSLLEVSPDGYFRYKEHRILQQGSAEYEEMVAQDGALVRFEERVRNGESGRRPVEVTVGEQTFRIASTGTVVAGRIGPEPELLPWSSFSNRQEDNVYFGLVDPEDEEHVAVGLWTAHVCISIGREFDPSNVTEIYRHGK